jgi:hypothetical protein
MAHTIRFEDGCVSRAEARRMRAQKDLIRRKRREKAQGRFWDGVEAEPLRFQDYPESEELVAKFLTENGLEG